jgi:hypothetical protein
VHVRDLDRSSPSTARNQSAHVVAVLPVGPAHSHSPASVPAPPGRTLALVDRSGSTSKPVPFHHGDPTEQVPAEVPVYTWNLAGHRAGHGPSGTANRHTFGGLSDAAFRMVPLLEAGRDADWPWAA